MKTCATLIFLLTLTACGDYDMAAPVDSVEASNLPPPVGDYQPITHHRRGQ